MIPGVDLEAVGKAATPAEVDPELIALPAPPRREGTRAVILMLVTAVASVAMCWALRTEVAYSFSKPVPQGLGELEGDRRPPVGRELGGGRVMDIGRGVGRGRRRGAVTGGGRPAGQAVRQVLDGRGAAPGAGPVRQVQSGEEGRVHGAHYTVFPGWNKQRIRRGQLVPNWETQQPNWQV